MKANKLDECIYSQYQQQVANLYRLELIGNTIVMLMGWRNTRNGTRGALVQLQHSNRFCGYQVRGASSSSVGRARLGQQTTDAFPTVEGVV